MCQLEQNEDIDLNSAKIHSTAFVNKSTLCRYFASSFYVGTILWIFNRIAMECASDNF